MSPEIALIMLAELWSLGASSALAVLELIRLTDPPESIWTHAFCCLHPEVAITKAVLGRTQCLELTCLETRATVSTTGSDAGAG